MLSLEAHFQGHFCWMLWRLSFESVTDSCWLKDSAQFLSHLSQDVYSHPLLLLPKHWCPRPSFFALASTTFAQVDFFSLFGSYNLSKQAVFLGSAPAPAHGASPCRRPDHEQVHGEVHWQVIHASSLASPFLFCLIYPWSMIELTCDFARLLFLIII